MLSLEASAIYGKIQENGEEVGYDLPAKKNYAYFRMFKNILD